ncbi:MAG: hypothetical protein L6Q26_09220 [Anaerolineales bacterium]|nr:hypothetical protein [Anaerolineales bacterium]NUQ84684.1 hypothetical protein [Anaerolineales bacterium]
MATFDLNVLPIHRHNGQEFADLPGLLAAAPPRRAARGRDKDSLVLYFMPTGNAVFTVEEIGQLAANAVNAFFQTPGSLTFAMRKTAEHVNAALLERNLSTTGRGQYALGILVLAAVRKNLCTLSLSGPSHAVWITEGAQRHIHDPALSGKGLGSGQSFQTYLTQIEFQPNDLIALCGVFPKDWEADLLNSRPPATLDACYRKLTFTNGDLNAALIQPQNGHGVITVLRPAVSASRPPHPQPAPASQERILTESFEERAISNSPILEPHPPDQQEISPSPITEDELDALADFGAHYVQPSAYAIPPQPESIHQPPASTPAPGGPRSFPPSIPRLKPAEPKAETEDLGVKTNEYFPAKEDDASELLKPIKPTAHAEAARQMAKVMVGGIKTGRRVNERLGNFLRNFIPKLLPGSDSNRPLVVPTYVMASMAIIVPVLVAVVSWVVYSKYGLSETYFELYQQALVANGQASSETEPTRQRDAYQRVLDYVDQAEQYRETDETKLLRSEAQAKWDNLMGVIRLEFIPAFTNGLGGNIQISRMAASESDLYMLDAERGNILHATFTGRSLEPDGAFNCQPGTYGGYQVGTIVDILALPKVNAVGASVLGIDTSGNLLYCSPGQVPQVFPLPPLPNTNWGRITSFTLDSDTLYILDSEARAVWVYRGKDSAFLDPPYFFFGNQIPDIENAIDLAVSGDDLYLLHADGRLSTCAYSRIPEVPTRCVDPAPRIDNFPAHRDMDIFAQAHLTQMALTTPPNPVVLLLDSENRSVFRLTPRSLELQNQVTGYAGKASPFQQGPIGAMAISPNYILYLAIGNQVYFATNLP